MRFTDIFPDIPPVRRLVVAGRGQQQRVDFWVWLRSLQGLVNRQEPHLYLLSTPGTGAGRHPDLYEQHWLRYYTETFGLPVEEIAVEEAIDRYRHLVRGYVVYDNEGVIQTQNLAITLAGLEGTLPVSPDQEARLAANGIPKVDDLRGRFRSNDDAAEWALDHLWPRCNKHLYANLCVHRPFWYSMCHELEDFIVYHRGLALDLPLSRQTRRSRDLYRRMLSEAEPPGVQMNWHCILDQEKEYVAEAARQGFFTLCSVHSPNLSIHGGVGDTSAAYTQPRPDPARCRAEKGKVYVCLYVSDGDATWAMNNLHSDCWAAPERGGHQDGVGAVALHDQALARHAALLPRDQKRQRLLLGAVVGRGLHLHPPVARAVGR